MNNTGTVLHSSGVSQRREISAAKTADRLDLRRRNAEGFFGNMQLPNRLPNDEGLIVGNKLIDWISTGSWKQCPTCGSAVPIQLTESFLRGRFPSSINCPCSSRYHVPMIGNWPYQLVGLTKQDQDILSLYKLHYGSGAPRQHGYRCKDGAVYATLRPIHVLQRISSLESAEQQQRLRHAYHYLRSSSDSSYGDFLTRFENAQLQPRLHGSQLFEEKFVETALWPLLYPFNMLCETAVQDTGCRESAKKSYVIKVLSGVLDYCAFFPLLRFQYDRWIYKTISGAINSATIMNCSPARALDSKCFSPTYWEWQLGYIVDAVRQFGYPHIFMTVAPYEWTFPGSDVLRSRMDALGRGPTELGSLETLHFAHVLQQILRGYISGKGKKPWKSNLLRNVSTNFCNVKTYFYRFEFQQRGTVHVHYIAWLDDVSKLDVNRFSADFPVAGKDFAYLVYNAQKSNKKVPGLCVSDEPNHIAIVADRPVLCLRRSLLSDSVNLRIYVDTLLTALKSNMDLQMSDGKALLLRYVASYVSKYRDHSVPREVLFADATAHSIAYRYLCDLQPAEPEMVMSLADIKMAYTCSDTKRFLVPTFERASTNNVVKAYMSRPQSAEQVTLYDYLHTFTVTKDKGHRRQSNKDLLVSIKYVNLYSDMFFFQDSLLFTPFRKLSDLQHASFESLPVDIKMFSFAITNRSAFWQDHSRVESMCQERCNRDSYTKTFLSYLVSLFQTWNAHFGGRFSFHQLNISLSGHHPSTNLSPLQASFVNGVVDRVRAAVLSMDHATCDTPSTRYSLLCGTQGTGKSLCLKEIIRQCLTMSYRVLVLTPTGLLASSYRASFGNDLVADTVHAAFKISVPDSSTSSINWELRQYDVIIIDEISMVSQRHGDHIASTLSFASTHSVVVLCGDPKQLQPVPVDGVTGSLFTHRQLMSRCDKVTLQRQFRTEDAQLSNFLSLCRYSTPSKNSIETFASGIVLLDTPRPSDHDLMRIHDAYNDFKLLTFTQASSIRYNVLIRDHQFRDASSALMARYPTPDSQIQPVFLGMPVVITENRQKSRSFVNGQIGHVHAVMGRTVILLISGDRLIRVYPITADNGIYYPFSLSYSSTIHKVQGQTLDKVLLWFDTDYMPAGCAYVAMSRVRRREHLRFLVPPKRSQFIPSPAQ